jgi:uncharacterized protein involved in exopolysaccharide biosynthesis
MTDKNQVLQCNAALAQGEASKQMDLNLAEVFAALRYRWLLIAFVSLLAALLGFFGSYLIPPSFTARTSFLPPQQQQGGASSALASLGLLAGAAGGVRNTGDQYVSLIQSTTIADRMIDRFDLLKVYDEKLRIDARLELARSTRVNLGKKDGVISLEVDDNDPKRVAEIANAYVDELRLLTARLALTEAQQRRVFFEGQLRQARDQLTQAQSALQSSGMTANAIKAEPKAAAEGFAKLKADATAAAVRLQVMQRSLAAGSYELQQQAATVAALQAELVKLGQTDTSGNQAGYIGAYREFKYREALFDLLARQYESAKVDESRDGGQLQLIDIAQVPERKSKPKRSLLLLAGFGIGFMLACLWVMREYMSRRSYHTV